jgi:hypothetical protein
VANSLNAVNPLHVARSGQLPDLVQRNTREIVVVH